MKTRDKNPWTETESQLLADYYYTLSREELFKILPGRTLPKIIEHVAYLKKRNKTFQGI